MSDRRLVVWSWLLVGLSGCVANGLVSSPVGAQEAAIGTEQQTERGSNEAGVDGLAHQPATTVADWIAQIEASLVQITGVRVEATKTGLQVVLETADGSLEVPETRSSGKVLIAEIPNATIAEEFSQANPIEGIALVSVTSLPNDRVRVAITGTDVPPVAEVRLEAQGLVLAVTSGDAEAGAEEEIEVVVTGEPDKYRVPNASTATRTDTPIRDIPQSIQVVPRQVLEDRNVRTVSEAVETVSGVVETAALSNSPVGVLRTIRGFEEEASLRNGLRDGNFRFEPIGTVEQIEVLKGPASVLFGAVEPGGVINITTRQPLDEPYYKLGFEAGSFGLYQPSIDLSGPLTADKNVLYRFIAAYRGAGSFQDRANSQTTTIAPSFAFKLGDRTKLNLYYEYSRYYANPYTYFVPLLSDGRLPPASFYPNYSPSVNLETQRLGYTLNHELNDNWQIRNNLAISFKDYTLRETYYSDFVDDRLITGYRIYAVNTTESDYNGQIDVVGKFKTGSISHQLVAGFDFNRREGYRGLSDHPGNLPDLDISNPNYNIPKPEFPATPFTDQTIDQTYGVYLQDQIAFSDNLKLLIGGRYDWVSASGYVPIDSDLPSQNDGAFSPRIGLVYQPSKNVSLYTSYSQSFRQSVGQNPDNRAFEPTRGTQYEIGVKTDFLDGRLSATLAAYHLTKTNVLTADPDPILAQQGFQVQVGEQRSRGIELDVAGEILPGWNVVASYAFTDAEVTADNSIPSVVGNRLIGVPENQASLWTTYEIQTGNLQGLGFGLGLFYVGERQGNLANSALMDDYFRTDAAIYYRRNGFNAAINVRNLFNTDYLTRKFDSLYVLRGEPFSIIGSVSWEF
ncbi:MAG: TonB-dependent siderophore receptor [Cyanosarcina radialis HA8281-LM2]|jgi:iron complex outermembrane receptor protein|nr:TonB-dependent siderophore receptor [Cyanosarcina radialis HA8281-LM2]